jgi:lipopolysaccharide transport system permease protein
LQLSLLISLTRRDFTERYSGSILGVLWSFLWPLVTILIYTLIFSKIMGARLPGSSSAYSYAVYLVAGLLPWTAFANTVSRASTVFVERKHIITKINVSLPSFPLYILLSESVTFLISLAIYVIFLLCTGIGLSKFIVLLPFLYLSQQIFAYALGFFIAMFHVFLRDLKEVTAILLQVWFWFTPIVYVQDILPEMARKIMAFNPAYLFIRAYQDIFVFQKLPDLDSLLILVVLGHVFLLAGYLAFKKLEKDVRDFI